MRWWGMHERTAETLRFLSGGKIRALPEPTRPEPEIDPIALQRATQLAGTNRVTYTQRGAGWDPLPEPEPDVIDWSAEALRRQGLA